MRKYWDKKLFLILLGYMATYHIVYLGRRIILKAMGRPEYFEISWWETALRPLLANFLIVPPAIMLIIVVTKTMIDRNLKWSYMAIVHFILSLIYSFVLTAFIYVYLLVFESMNLSAITLEDFFVQTLFSSNLNYLGYVGFITIIYVYYYIEKISRTEIQKAKLTQQLQAVRLQFLRSQLNPHFLFNTLNSISSLIREDTYKAQHILGNLGDLLREVLQTRDKNMIPLTKEMEILEKYLEIMKTRFSDHLNIVIEIDQSIKNVLVPSMLFQPLLENSLAHGYSYESTHLNIKISVLPTDEHLLISVENDGPRIEGSVQNKGLGIQNIKDRLNTLFDRNFTFRFFNLEQNGGVRTEIKIPLLF
ncbi:MAG: histidine kinase [Bacteroidota bacterium]